MQHNKTSTPSPNGSHLLRGSRIEKSSTERGGISVFFSKAFDVTLVSLISFPKVNHGMVKPCFSNFHTFSQIRGSI